MFQFRKKKKSEPHKEWLELLTIFYAESGLTAEIIDYPLELLTYGLGYLSEFLRVTNVKDKEVAEIEHDFLKHFGSLNDQEATNMRREIDRSTSETKPVLIELIFLGVEAYTQKESLDFANSGQEILQLIRT